MSKLFRCPQALFSISQMTGPKAQPPDSEDMRKGRRPAFGHALDDHKSKGKSCKLDGSLLVAGRQSGQLLRRTWDRCADLRRKASASPKFDFSTLQITGRRAKSVACRSVLVGGLQR